ncbi:hypothetical protein [Neorhizobium galegae]|nr:hypothetical protein [Neorhizobium galegae]CDZ27530.1 Hypothetical protein NGAL_HAMBI490_23760 [Neorhizobium galegae bv. officinalis]KAA9386532.1 hypothetical protein F4V88_08660 [Neorhizobium galegae]KAB1111073.1 hypothetical protein F4V89_21855 [Neorhizobium galegae]MCM2498571.1 hypothetical protein [Neorhizobium galegae]MCQ1767551.1 hypothetical protein [Neorhizobium galegae]
MRNIAFYFFGAAVLCVTVGMFWGIQMAISGDHLMAPAHAHLNLVGWTTMGLFGLYYTVTPAAADSVLSKVHLGFAVLGVLCLVPGIAMAVSAGGEALAAIGSILTVVSMLIFLFTVARNGIGRKTA